jgi:hypothetical protein
MVPSASTIFLRHHPKRLTTGPYREKKIKIARSVNNKNKSHAGHIKWIDDHTIINLDVSGISLLMKKSHLTAVYLSSLSAFALFSLASANWPFDTRSWPRLPLQLLKLKAFAVTHDDFKYYTHALARFYARPTHAPAGPTFNILDCGSDTFLMRGRRPAPSRCGRILLGQPVGLI